MASSLAFTFLFTSHFHTNIQKHLQNKYKQCKINKTNQFTNNTKAIQNKQKIYKLLIKIQTKAKAINTAKAYYTEVLYV